MTLNSLLFTFFIVGPVASSVPALAQGEQVDETAAPTVTTTATPIAPAPTGSATSTTPAAPATPKGTLFTTSTAAPFLIPDDINGHRTIVAAPPAVSRTLSIAIYEGPGSGKGGVDNVSERASQIPGAKITRLTPEQVGTVDLSQFDIVAFSGGSGSGQARAIGEAGRANVKKFVENGGGYLGICAGAYLATSGYDWSLGILNAKTVSPKWQRGRTFVDLEVSKDGEAIIGATPEPTFKCRYNNGPIIASMGRTDIPAYTTVAWFRSEISENGSPEGVMINSPAAAYATYGKGRVFVISPHPENTPGLEHFVPRALLWLGHSGTFEDSEALTAATAQGN
ncbi:MAG: BPL-N domain-containing protein [Rariglobus sp.]